MPRPRKEDVRIIQNWTGTENRRSKEKGLTYPSIEDPEEQMHLRRTISNSQHWKVKLVGRQQSRVSNGNEEVSGKVTVTFTFSTLHQLNWPHL